MTIRELSQFFNCSFANIFKFYEKALQGEGEIADRLRKKAGTSNKRFVVDYKLDEVCYILKYNAVFTPMIERFLIEHFIHREEQYIDKRKKPFKLSGDIGNFVFMCKNGARYPKACASCAYLLAKKMNKVGSRFSPYCNFYNVFLNKALPKRNIYKDYCPTYVRTEKEPLVFFKNVTNLDSYGNISSTTLGFDNSVFTTGSTKKTESIKLVKEV